jgi:hypothetical protein
MICTRRRSAASGGLTSAATCPPTSTARATAKTITALVATSWSGPWPGLPVTTTASTDSRAGSSSTV